MSYKDLTNEELVALYKNGDKQAINVLIYNCTGIIKNIIKSLNCNENEKNDLEQLGRIAVLKAADAFDGDKGVKFSTFVYTCIKNIIFSAFRKMANDINYTMCESLSNIETENGTYSEDKDNRLADYSNSPEEQYILKEKEIELESRRLKALSLYEKNIYLLYSTGLTYLQIARELNKTEKSVDNAMCRINTKLKIVDKQFEIEYEKED